MTYHLPKYAFMDTTFLTVLPKHRAFVIFFPQLTVPCIPRKLLERARCKVPYGYNFQVVMLAGFDMDLLCPEM